MGEHPHQEVHMVSEIGGPNRLTSRVSPEARHQRREMVAAWGRETALPNHFAETRAGAEDRKPLWAEPSIHEGPIPASLLRSCARRPEAPGIQICPIS